MGQPLRRVWETKEETVVEEWIYGERPYKVIFVEFHGNLGDKESWSPSRMNSVPVPDPRAS